MVISFTTSGSLQTFYCWVVDISRVTRQRMASDPSMLSGKKFRCKKNYLVSTKFVNNPTARRIAQTNFVNNPTARRIAQTKLSSYLIGITLGCLLPIIHGNNFPYIDLFFRKSTRKAITYRFFVFLSFPELTASTHIEENNHHGQVAHYSGNT